MPSSVAKRSPSPGYRSAVAWIACNDDRDIGEVDTGFIVSICMVADLWEKEQEIVARDVLRYRKKMERADG